MNARFKPIDRDLLKSKKEKYFSSDFLPAKTLIINKIATIKFFKNLSFGVNFKKHKMYKINTQKINGVRKIGP